MAGLGSDGVPQYAALVPLVDCMRHDGSEFPVLQVAEEETMGGAMVVAAAMDTVSIGSELRFAFDQAGSAQLLAQYGYVPPSDDLEQARRINFYHHVALPIRVYPEKLDKTGQDLWGNKLELLAHKAGLDLRGHHRGVFLEYDIDETSEKRWLSLPKDFYPGGRLLPTARFLTQNPKDGQTNKGLMVELFIGVKGMTWVPGEVERAIGTTRYGSEPPLERKPLPRGAQFDAEVKARVMAAEWVEVLLKRLQRGAALLYPQLEGAEVDVGAASADPTEVKVGDVVLAHFKARGNVKSKKAKDARVMALLGGMLAVQFLENGVRHTVPRDWVLGAPQGAEEAEGAGDLEARLRKQSRGILALSLLNSEIAVVSEVLAGINQFLHAALALSKATAPEEISGIVDTLHQVWEYEQDLIEEWRQRDEMLQRAQEEPDA